MDDFIKQKLEEIANCIYDKIEKEQYEEGLGLYTGDFGILLFLFYYARYSQNEKFITLVDLYTEKLLVRLGSQLNSHTYCNGLSGILYLFELLRENKFIDINVNDIGIDLQKYLSTRMMNDIKKGNYDFMLGALGVGFYSLKISNNVVINELINFLYNTSEIDNNSIGLKWKSIIDVDKNKFGYNISLSHGISSIIIFLCKAFDKGINHNRLEYLIIGAVHYILGQEIDYEIYGSFFPYYSIESSIDTDLGSRLAWCYGDLGVAYSLWYAGKIMKNEEWENKGLDILLQSTKRCTKKESKIVDAGICHGSIGLVMLYRHLYFETQNNIFLEAIHFWLQQTIDLAIFDDGLAGYKSFTVEWIKDYSLLTGISGVGLIFILYLDGTQKYEDEIFIL